MKKMKLKPLLNGKLMFPKDNLVAEDLEGKDWPLTISRVSMGEVVTDSGPQPMPFIYFEEMERKGSKKRLGLNITNARMIAKLTGKLESTDWVGEKIVIYPTTCDAFGETVTCVRIRPKLPRKRREAVEKSREERESSSSEPDLDAGEMSEEEEQRAFGGDS